MALKTYHGSCHCKKISYTATLDLAKGTTRCNCTYCKKTRTWSARTQPKNVQLNADASDLGSYNFRENSTNHHLFCKNCGTRIGTRGFISQTIGDYFSVMVSTLDDATPADLLSGPIHYLDGLHDNWAHEITEISHL